MKTSSTLITTCGVLGLLFAGASAADDVIASIKNDHGKIVGHNVMVTFDTDFFAEDLGGPRMTPFTYDPLGEDRKERASVTIETLEGDISVAIGPEFEPALAMGMPAGPTTRFLKTPLLATIGMPDDFGDLPDALRLGISFETPTPLFGFGFGFNAKYQPQDGAPTDDPVGQVSLYDKHGDLIGEFPLYPSRLFCCTETRFDYSRCDTDSRGSGYVRYAEINFEYDYTPFDPGGVHPTGPKFFGIDDMTYSTVRLGCDD